MSSVSVTDKASFHTSDLTSLTNSSPIVTSTGRHAMRDGMVAVVEEHVPSRRRNDALRGKRGRRGWGWGSAGEE